MSDPERHSSTETAERVLALLRDRADDCGIVQVTRRAIGAELGLGRQTAHRALAFLAEDGRIEVARPGTGAGYPTTYRLLDSPKQPDGCR